MNIEFDFYLGSWVIPALLTAAIFLLVKLGYGGATYDDWGIGALVITGLALIASLVVWLIWALLT